jgi:hypothetical protein
VRNSPGNDSAGIFSKKASKSLKFKTIEKLITITNPSQLGIWRCEIKSLNKILLGAFVLVSFSGCGSGSVDDEKLPEAEPAKTVEEPIVEFVEEDKEAFKYIEYDLSLKKDMIIESDNVVFNAGVEVLTNGYELEVKAKRVILNENTFNSYKAYASSCDTNGKTAKDLYFNSQVITGVARVNLRGSNGGLHCKVKFGFKNNESECAKKHGGSYGCGDYLKTIKPYRGGNAGRIIYNSKSNIDVLELEVSKKYSVGTPKTSIRHNYKNMWIDKGRGGSSTGMCALINKVLVCGQ